MISKKELKREILSQHKFIDNDVTKVAELEIKKIKNKRDEMMPWLVAQ